MTIQWYPGHMHKAQKEMRESIPKVDLVIEVLDARIPFSSENPMLSSVRGEKPCIKVLSKSDLADKANIQMWQAHLEKERNVKVFAISTEDRARMKSLPELCYKVLPHKAEGVTTFRAMIAGIPNVGKSTLINVLAGKNIAKTGNEPAVTKAQQFIRITDNFLLLDTPGILWPKQKYEKSSYRLALTGAVKDTAMDYADVAFFGAEFLMKVYPERLLNRYELDTLPSSEIEFFEIIGRARGCLGAGGRVDLTKISEQFVRDFRDGSLGGISLETPAMIQKEMEDHELAEQEKEEKKAKRKENFKRKKR